MRSVRISSTSRKPLVVIRPTRAPICSSMALDAPAVPWRASSITAPADGGRTDVAEEVAQVCHYGELAGERRALDAGVRRALGRGAGAAAVKAERAMIAALGADLQSALLLEEPVIAPERHAAAIL